MYGENIRMLREQRGYSQEYIASRLGIAQNTYSRIERNQIQVSVERFHLIAEVLNVPVTQLMNHYPALADELQGEYASFRNVCVRLEEAITTMKIVTDKMRKNNEVILGNNREILILLKEKNATS